MASPYAQIHLALVYDELRKRAGLTVSQMYKSRKILGQIEENAKDRAIEEYVTWLGEQI